MRIQRKAIDKKLVIIGGGFAGLYVAKTLSNKNALDITLIDKRNFHLFQPLLYQVATGGLSATDIAAPLRAILKRRKNVNVLQHNVVDIDLESKLILTESDQKFPYDCLVVATGVTHDYFGNDDWKHVAPGLKTVEDSVEIRCRILSAFERAENENDERKKQELLTFVIIGGGPTGVELAGAIGELASNTLRDEYRNIDLDKVRTVIIEGGDRLLSSFPEKLSKKAKKQLERLRVEVRLRCFATNVDETSVSFQCDNSQEQIKAQTVLWAAGVKASKLNFVLAKKTGAELDDNGRIKVLPDLSINGHPEIVVAGDAISLIDANGRLVPGLAPAAIQQGAYVAKKITAMLNGGQIKPFTYHDKGNLAVVGRNAAVASIGPFKLSGFIAWVTWAIVHIYFLIDFGNKLAVIAQWAWSYITKKRGARLITLQRKIR